MTGKQIPRITEQKQSPLSAVLSALAGVAVLTGLLAFLLWLATVIAGRTDLVTYRECVGVAFALIMVRAIFTTIASMGRSRT